MDTKNASQPGSLAVVPCSASAGPWKAVMGAEGEPDRWIVVADGPTAWSIATVENGQPGDCLETEAATARLIAAAPDLLESLENLLPVAIELLEKAFERGELKFPVGNISEVLHAQAAISKCRQNAQPNDRA